MKQLIAILIICFLILPAQSEETNKLQGAIKGAATGQKITPAHGLAMHGKLKHAPDFTSFSYVNPDAKKGGTVKLGVQGTFDNLNPFIVRGVAAAGLRGNIFESLMARAMDEPFTLYGHLAETVSVPDDRSSITFKLRDIARFSDGKPITADDVIFTHALLRDHGRPNHRSHYSKVAEIKKLGRLEVRFTFKTGTDREMPLIIGLMPILPKHFYDPETFEQTTLKPPTGSGPYKVDLVEAGKSIIYKRNKNYWAKNLPTTRGRFNFDKIRYDYYRDAAALFEAFKKGLIDIRYEGDPGKWNIAYDFPAAKSGKVKREAYDLGYPSGMDALVFNTRRPQFRDIRVRKALTLLFDFEWINKNLYHNAYVRTQSFFDRSLLSSNGKKADAYEWNLLKPFIDELDNRIIEGVHKFPVSDGKGRNRSNLKAALKLFDEANYGLKGGKLTEKGTGEPFTFEILAASRSQERLFLNYVRSLKRAGIDARIRLVDSAQYQQRRQTFDFDMLKNRWGASLSPGNEQIHRWASKYANTDGSYNLAGVKSPAVDEMINAILAAREHEDFVSSVRALDRALLSGNYVLPLYHMPKQWMAYWRRIAHPKSVSLYGYPLDTWWYAGEVKVE